MATESRASIGTESRSGIALEIRQHRDDTLAPRHLDPRRHRRDPPLAARQQPLSGIATAARATAAEETGHQRIQGRELAARHGVAERHCRDPPPDPARQQPLSGIATAARATAAADGIWIPPHQDGALAPRHGVPTRHSVVPTRHGRDPPRLEPMRQQQDKEARREAIAEGEQESTVMPWIAWVLGWVLPLVLWLGKLIGAIVVAILNREKAGAGVKLFWGMSQGTLRGAWTACSLLTSCMSKKAVFRLATAGMGLGATFAGVQFLADASAWGVLRGAVCMYGPYAPVVGEWVGARCASGWGRTQQQQGLVLPSTRHVVAYPTYKGPLVDAQACARDLKEATRSLARHMRLDKQGTLLRPRDQREAEDRMNDEAQLVLVGLGTMADALVDAAKQVKGTQHDVLEVLDYIVLYPGGGEAAWYERFMADFVTRGNSGSMALQKRVKQAISLLSKAQTERAKLVDALESGITLPTLCDDKSQAERHSQTYSLQQDASRLRANLQDRLDKMARAARRWTRKRDEEERKRQISLAALEKAEIHRLETEAVSGPAILAAKVSLPCDCLKIIQDTANHFVKPVKWEIVDLLPEVLAKLEGLQDEIVSWGMFPQSSAIEEGQAKLVRFVEGYLQEVVSVYTRDWSG